MLGRDVKKAYMLRELPNIYNIPSTQRAMVQDDEFENPPAFNPGSTIETVPEIARPTSGASQKASILKTEKPAKSDGTS